MSEETSKTESSRETGNEEKIVAGKILKEEKKQSRKATAQTIALTVIAVCVVIITVAVVGLINNVNSKLETLFTKADTAITTLNEVANGINEADLPSMAEQIKDLTSDATDGIATTMDKIDSLDIDSLNDSIARLDDATATFQTTVQGFNAIFGH